MALKLFSLSFRPNSQKLLAFAFLPQPLACLALPSQNLLQTRFDFGAIPHLENGFKKASRSDSLTKTPRVVFTADLKWTWLAYAWPRRLSARSMLAYCLWVNLELNLVDQLKRAFLASKMKIEINIWGERGAQLPSDGSLFRHFHDIIIYDIFKARRCGMRSIPVINSRRNTRVTLMHYWALPLILNLGHNKEELEGAKAYFKTGGKALIFFQLR